MRLIFKKIRLFFHCFWNNHHSCNTPNKEWGYENVGCINCDWGNK